MADEIELGNGMVVTPDNSTLIVAESFGGRLSAFDIGVDGGLSNRRVWADGLGSDGICIDAEGAVWTSVAEKDVARIAEAGRSCSGSNSTGVPSRACSEAPNAGRCT